MQGPLKRFIIILLIASQARPNTIKEVCKAGKIDIQSDIYLTDDEDYLSIVKKNVSTSQNLHLENIDDFFRTNDHVYVNYHNKKAGLNYKFLIKIYPIKNEAIALKEFDNHKSEAVKRRIPAELVGILSLYGCMADKKYIFMMFEQKEDMIPFKSYSLIKMIRGLDKEKHLVYMSYLAAVLYLLTAKIGKAHLSLDVNSLFMSKHTKKFKLGNLENLTDLTPDSNKRQLLQLVKTMLYLDSTFVPIILGDNTNFKKEKMFWRELSAIDTTESLIKYIDSKCTFDPARFEKKLRETYSGDTGFDLREFFKLISKTGRKLANLNQLSIKQELKCSTTEIFYKSMLTDSVDGQEDSSNTIDLAKKYRRELKYLKELHNLDMSFISSSFISSRYERASTMKNPQIKRNFSRLTTLLKADDFKSNSEVAKSNTTRMLFV